MLKKITKVLLWLAGSIAVLFLALVIYLACVAIMYPPDVSQEKDYTLLERMEVAPDYYQLGRSWFRKSNSGLWELYAEGSPYERGVIIGKLTKELVIKQEDAFHDQICQMVPSRFYRSFLKYCIGWFNRDLDDNVPLENQLEIYGISQSASPQYEYIGSNYQRIMNYHAAHDIGHALQNLALVGCTSFATWNGRSADSSLIIGRNFDFYVGDKFAEDKIVEFLRPDKGYPFAMITWGGMTGVTSGMNLKGVTVTINAAKSLIPSGSAMPIALLARHILQYASNIDEAIKIANDYHTFVSESIMVGSAADNQTVLIEKTPEQIAVVKPVPNQNYMICTNHYQSDLYKNDTYNQEQIKSSASVYRYKRMQELLDNTPKNSVEQTIAILRDQKGLKGSNIGMGNEKAVNQLIAHHSIVFEPQKGLMWISTSPWQLGEYVAYDLNKIFSEPSPKIGADITTVRLKVQPDSFLQTPDFQNFLTFRQLKTDLKAGKEVDLQALITSNPEYYDTYVLAGNAAFSNKDLKAAKGFYQTALTKEIATQGEKTYIENQLKKCDAK